MYKHALGCITTCSVSLSETLEVVWKEKKIENKDIWFNEANAGFFLQRGVWVSCFLKLGSPVGFAMLIRSFHSEIYGWDFKRRDFSCLTGSFFCTRRVVVLIFDLAWVLFFLNRITSTKCNGKCSVYVYSVRWSQFGYAVSTNIIRITFNNNILLPCSVTLQ